MAKVPDDYIGVLHHYVDDVPVSRFELGVTIRRQSGFEGNDLPDCPAGDQLTPDEPGSPGGSESVDGRHRAVNDARAT